MKLIHIRSSYETASLLLDDVIVAIEVQSELSTLGESFIANVAFIVGLVLFDVPCQELRSQEHLVAHHALEATLVLPMQHHVSKTDKKK